MRSLETCYLANYIIDFKRNQRKYLEQAKVMKDENFVISRDNLWRGQLVAKNQQRFDTLFIITSLLIIQ